MAREKKPSKSKIEIQERRKSQLAALDLGIEALSKKLADLKHKKQKVELLQSVSLGLYDEMDKLAKKAGTDQVTDLALEQLNDVMSAAGSSGRSMSA